MKTIVFDFDGVIASYSGWKGFDVLGEPNYEVIKTMQHLKSEGYRIIIFTTRPATPTLTDWLKRYTVPYDDINRNSHNPPMTSIKPIYHCYIDDRALNYKNQNSKDLILQINEIVEKSGE